MATNRVWEVKYVAGNPAMFSKVITASGGPFRRSEALEAAKVVADNCDTWRVWVEHNATGERIFESAAEIKYKTAAAA